MHDKPDISSKTFYAVARYLLVGVMLCTVFGLTGCARPKGALFPPAEPRLTWPQPPEPSRIAWVGQIRDSRDLKAARSGMEALTDAIRGPLPPVRLLGPNGLALHDNRWLAIADTQGARVHILDLEQRTHTAVSGISESERFVAPVGATWVGTRLFFTDAGRAEVIELDTLGTVRSRFGQGMLKRPVGIAYAPCRHVLYVVDGGAHVVYVFTVDGVLTQTLGTRGDAPGAFNYPSHLAVRNDVLLVADSGNFRVQVLDLDGVCRAVIGKKGDGAGDFALPKGVAISEAGHVYVVDAQFENVQIFRLDGMLLLAFGEEGMNRGQFSLPSGIALDELDRIWVSDSGNHRVQVFASIREEP